MARPRTYRDTPPIDYHVGKLTGVALTWLAKRAIRRGDAHEFTHCVDALRVGNSNHALGECPLLKSQCHDELGPQQICATCGAYNAEEG